MMKQVLSIIVIFFILQGIAASQQENNVSATNRPAITFFKVMPGARVRVMAPGITIDKIRGQEKTVTLEGTVESAYNDTILFKGIDYPDLLTIPLLSIDRFEIHRGKSGDEGAVTGGLCGLLLGAGAGGIIGYELGGWEFSRPVAALIGAGTFGFIGYYIGVAVGGTATQSEKWEEVPPESLRIGFVPSLDGGYGLAAVMSF